MRKKVINGIPYVSLSGAAKIVGIHRNTMINLVDTGVIPTRKFGTTFRYLRESDVQLFMERGADAFTGEAA